METRIHLKRLIREETADCSFKLNYIINIIWNNTQNKIYLINSSLDLSYDYKFIPKICNGNLLPACRQGKKFIHRKKREIYANMLHFEPIRKIKGTINKKYLPFYRL